MRALEEQGPCHPAVGKAANQARFGRLVLDRGARCAIEMRADLAVPSDHSIRHAAGAGGLLSLF